MDEKLKGRKVRAVLRRCTAGSVKVGTFAPPKREALLLRFFDDVEGDLLVVLDTQTGLNLKSVLNRLLKNADHSRRDFHDSAILGTTNEPPADAFWEEEGDDEAGWDDHDTEYADEQA